MKTFLSFVFLFLFVSIFVVAFGGVAYVFHPAFGFFVAVFLYYVFFFTNLKAHWAWQSLPTLEDYLAMHSHCQGRNGITCFQCNSRSIKNWGLNSANDQRRMHICNHCNTTLYRTV